MHQFTGASQATIESAKVSKNFLFLYVFYLVYILLLTVTP